MDTCGRDRDRCISRITFFVEALTVVFAVGAMRGWRGALAGTGLAIAALAALIAALGPALTRIPIEIVQVVVGGLLLLFGLRWLRKAILRAAGIIPFHDELAAYAKETAKLSGFGAAVSALDSVAVATSFKIVCWKALRWCSSSSPLARVVVTFSRLRRLGLVPLCCW